MYHNQNVIGFCGTLIRILRSIIFVLLSCKIRDFTGTSKPTLVLLFFPLIPLSHKGATHKKKKKIAPRTFLAGNIFHPLQVLESQLSQVKLCQEKFGNIKILTKSGPFSLLLHFFYRIIFQLHLSPCTTNSFLDN
jgi:hypothetical protein